MKKGTRTFLIVLGIIALLIAFIYLMGQSFVFPEFSSAARAAARIPGLGEGFVPQGASTIESEGCVLISGYFKTDRASRLYLVYPDGSSKEINLQREDGSTYTGHAGGVSCWGDWVYISNASKIFYLPTKALVSAQDKGNVAFEGYFSVPCRASFVSCDGQYLYVGDYHAPGYDTLESHSIETEDGLQQALVLAYRMDEDAPFGIADTKPVAAYSVCDHVQGFCMVDGAKAVVSCSHGLSPSWLRVYEVGEPDGTFNEGGKEIPLYILDSRKLSKSMIMPHMSEDLECRDGEIYIGFESANKSAGAGFVPFSIKSIMVYPASRI